MDIDTLSTAALSAMRQDMVRSEVGTRVARTVLDAQKQQGEAAVALIRAAAEVADAGRLDVTA